MSRAFLRRNDTAEFENDNVRLMKPAKVGNTYGDGLRNVSVPDKGMDGIISDCKVVEMREKFIKCEMPILEKHLNIGLGLHGAVSMLIVDSIGGLLLYAARPGSNHVSTNISTSFFSGAGIGDVLEIDCFLEKMGRKLAFIKVNIYDKATKRKISSGSHTKYFVT